METPAGVVILVGLSSVLALSCPPHLSYHVMASRDRIAPSRRLTVSNVNPLCYEPAVAPKMNRSEVFHTHPEIMSGTPVFKGTRVPVHTLIDHLAAGVSLEEFLLDFPTVSREQAVSFLRLSEEALVGAKYSDD